MKKFAKSLKRIFVTCLSFLFVAVTFVGCGEKPGDDTPVTPADNSYQEFLLAQEKFSSAVFAANKKEVNNSEVPLFYLTDEVVSFDAATERLTYVVDNGVVITDLAGSDNFYINNGEETIQVIPNFYGSVENLGKYTIHGFNNGYVFSSYYCGAELRYSVIDYSNFVDVTQVYSKVSNGISFGVKLYANFIVEEEGISRKIYPLVDRRIDAGNAVETVEENVLCLDDSVFAANISSVLVVNYANSTTGNFETLSFEMGEGEYSIIKIGEDKYLIEKMLTSSVASSTAQKLREGVYANYSYQVLDISKAPEAALSTYKVTSGYCCVIPKQFDFVDGYNTVFEYKVNDNNAIIPEGMVKYYDQNMNLVLSYEATLYGTGTTPEVVFGKNCLYVAGNKIFSVNQNKAVSQVVDIKANGYRFENGYSAGNNFLAKKNGFYYVLNLNGQVVLSLEDLYITKEPIAFDGTRALVTDDLKYYVVDIENAVVEELVFEDGENIVSETILSQSFADENACLYYTLNSEGLYNFYNLESLEPVYANIEYIEVQQNKLTSNKLNHVGICVVKLVDIDENVYMFAINDYMNPSTDIDLYSYEREYSSDVDNYANIVGGSTSTATLYYDGEEIGSATITGLEYIITMNQGWYLNEYDFTLVFGNTPYSWTIKNTTFADNGHGEYVPSATLVETTNSGYGSLSAHLNDSANVVYVVLLNKNNAYIDQTYSSNDVVDAAVQRKQEIYFIVANYLGGCDGFLTTFQGVNYKILTKKMFVANTEETLAQIVLPDTIYSMDGHAVRWFYYEADPSSLPTGRSYSSMTDIGSAIDASIYTFAVTENRKTYVVAQYVKETNTILVEPDIGTYHAHSLSTTNMIIELVNPTAPKGYTFVGWKFEYMSADYSPYYTGENKITYTTKLNGTVVETKEFENTTSFEVKGTFTTVTITNAVIHGGTAKATALYEANTYTVKYYVVGAFEEGSLDTTYKHINIHSDYVLLKEVSVVFDQNYTVESSPAIPTGTTFMHWSFERVGDTYKFNIEAGAEYTPWEFDTNYNVYAVYSRIVYTVYFHEIGIDSAYHDYAYINDISKYEEARRTTITYGDKFSFSTNLFPVPDGTAFSSWKLFTGPQTSGTVNSSGEHNDGSNLFDWHYTTNLYVYEYYLPMTYAVHYYELKEPANAASSNYYDVSYINTGFYYEEARTDYAIFGQQYTVAGLTVTAPYGTTFAGWNFRETKVPSTSITVTPGVNAGQKFAWAYDYDVYYYACYTINTYKITYDFKNGTPGESIDSSFVEYKTGVTPANPVDGVKYTISYNETVYVPNPTRVGYNFRGWILEATSEDADLHQSGITSALVPFLSTTEGGDKVYYYQDGLGTVKYTIKDTYFARLNKNPGATVKFVAVWDAIGYNLVYELEGGTASASYPVSVSYDQTINLPHPTKFCNNFDGWSFYTKKDEKRFYFDENNMSTSYINLTTVEHETIYIVANWIPYKYTVVYDAIGGGTQTKVIDYGSVFSLSVPVKDHYEFMGWEVRVYKNTSKSQENATATFYYGTDSSCSVFVDGESTPIMVPPDGTANPSSYTFFKDVCQDDNGLVVAVARWQGVQYTIKFADAGFDPITTRYGIPVTITIPTKAGYQFVGWSLANMDTDVTHVYSINGSNTNKIQSTLPAEPDPIAKEYNTFLNLRGSAGEVEFSANWTPNTYTVKYVLNDLPLRTDPSNSGLWGPSDIYAEGGTVGQSFVVTNPSTDAVGYDFIGWKITCAAGLSPKVLYGTDSLALVEYNVTEDAIVISDLSIVCFQNLTLENNAEVVFTAVWRAHVYNIVYYYKDAEDKIVPFNYENIVFDYKDENGNPLPDSVTHTTTATYDVGFKVYDPYYRGYKFAGWGLQALSENSTHYYSDKVIDFTAPHVAAEWISFVTDTPSYTQELNPNLLQLINYSNIDYTDFKNLHFEDGATVRLVAHFESPTTEITYHYYQSSFKKNNDVNDVDDDYEYYDISRISLVGNLVDPINYNEFGGVSKTVQIKYGQYFNVFDVIRGESETNVASTTNGYRLTGWIFVIGNLKESCNSMTTSKLYDDYHLTLFVEAGSEHFFDKTFIGKHTNNVIAENYDENSDSGYVANAYAVYQIVNYTIIYMAAAEGGIKNDLSTYVPIWQQTSVQENGTSAVAINFGTHVYIHDERFITSYKAAKGDTTFNNDIITGFAGYMISNTFYEEGNVNRASIGASVGAHFNWFYSNELAFNQNYPVYYMYAIYEDDFYGTLEKVEITYESTGAYYKAKAKTYDRSVYKASGTTVIANDIKFPVYFHDGINGSHLVTHVESSAFASNTAITTVNFNKIINIGSSAFSGCTKLQEIILPNYVETVGESAFLNCSKANNLVISNTMTRIEKSTFENCSSIPSLVIPNSITYIGEAAFKGCSSIDYMVTIPNSVSTIAKDAFKNCTSIDHLRLSNAMTGLALETFSGCTQLRTVYFTDSIVATNPYVFNNCPITNVYYTGTHAEWSAISGLGDARISTSARVTYLIDSLTFEYVSGDAPYYTLKLVDAAFNTDLVIPDYWSDLVNGFENVVVIAANASYIDGIGNKQIMSIDIPNTVTTIGENAFRGAEGSTSLILGGKPASGIVTDSAIEYIGNYAFYNNAKCLSHIVIPETTTFIGAYAFANYATKATIATPINIYISDSVVTIGAYAFAETACNGKLYLGSRVKNGTKGAGHALVTIDTSAFQNCKALTLDSNVLSIYDNVTFIGACAFEGCESFVGSIYIGKKVATIGGGAFRYCKKITNVYFASYESKKHNSTWDYTESVKTIGDAAFSYCSVLKFAVLPNSVETMGTYAFAYNPALEYVIIGRTFGSASKLATIAEYTFYECSKLELVVIPKSVKTIKEVAFYGCTNLYDVCYTGSVDEYDAMTISNSYNDNYFNAILTYRIDLYTFTYNNDSSEVYFLTSTTATEIIRMPAKWMSFENYKFAPITKVRAGAINGNDAEEIMVSKNVSVLEKNSIVGSASLVLIDIYTISLSNFAASALGFDLSASSNVNVIIEPIVTRIPDNMFYQLSAVSSLTFNGTSTCTYIGKNSFKDTNIVASINAAKMKDKEDRTVEYQTQSFTKASGTTATYNTLVIPNSVLEIEEYSFQGCNKIQGLKLSTSLTKLAKYAFDGGSSIQGSITLPDTLDNSSNLNLFGTYAFNNCSSLEEVNIGSKIAYINPYTFNNNSSLEKIVIPNNVLRIDNYAFADCVTSVSLDLGTGIQAINTYAFSNNSSLQAIYIPDSVESIGTFAFYGCESAKTLRITTNSRYKIILESTFNGLTSLESLTIPAQITAINKEAFANCETFTYVFVPDLVTSLGEGAFENCVSLTHLTLGIKVQTISKFAFKNTPLAYVRLPSSTTTIGQEAFATTDLVTISTVKYGGSVAQRNAISIASGNEPLTNALVLWIYGTDKMTFEYLTDSKTYKLVSLDPSLVDPKFEVTNEWDDGVHGWAEVTVIGENCAKSNNKITHIIIPQAIRTIENDAFYGCVKVEIVDFMPNNMNDLAAGNEVFYSLGTSVATGTTVNIFANVTHVPAYLFEARNESLTYQANKITTINFYDSTGNESVCTSIDAYAFYDNRAVQEIYLPASLLYLEYCAFVRDASNSLVTVYYNNPIDEWWHIDIAEGGHPMLRASTSAEFKTKDGASNTYSVVKALTSPSDITVVGEFQFTFTAQFTSINITNNITTIERYAFSYCRGVVTLTIGEGVTSIATYAFYYMDKLVTVNFNSIQVANFSSANNVFGYAGISATGIDLNVGPKVKLIPNCFFDPTGSATGSPYLKRLNLATGAIATIGDYAFAYCDDLWIMKFPASVTTIGNAAFHNNTALVEILYGGTIAQRNAISVGTSNSCYTNAYFYYEIAKMTFSYSSSTYRLTDVEANFYEFLDIPYHYHNDTNGWANVTHINDSACQSLPNVVRATLPKTLTNIGKSIFDSCDKLETIYYHKTAANFNGITVSTTNAKMFATTLLCNDNFTYDSTNGVYIFAKDDYDTTITKYGNSSSLKFAHNMVFIPWTWNDNTNGWKNITKVANNAFKDNTSIVKVQTMDNIVEIGVNAFYGCSAIRTFVLSGNIAKIGADAFYYVCCKNIYFHAHIDKWWFVELVTAKSNPMYSSNYETMWWSLNGGSYVKETDITSPTGLDTVYAWQFWDFDQLVSVTITDEVTSIGEKAFFHCTGLTTLVIGDGVTTIGISAFQACPALTTVTIGAAVVDVANDVFLGDEAITTIFYHNNINEWWHIAFADIDSNPMYATAETAIMKSLNASNEYIKVVALTSPSDITEVGVWQFYNFDQFTSVTITANVTNINTKAFYACDGIVTLTLNAGVTVIDTYAFYHCDKINAITIPNTVTNVNQEAFAYCTSAVTITVNGNGAVLDRCSFYSCTAATTIRINSGVKTIKNSAFYDSTAATTIAINNSVETIETYAFYNTTASAGAAATITIGSSTSSKLTAIEADAFRNAKWAKNITIYTASTGVIHENAFEGASVSTSAGTISITNVKTIETEAFKGCTGIATISITGSSASVIETVAFKGCTTLSTLNINNNIKTIGESAFEGCSTAGSAATYNIGATSSAAVSTTLETIGKKAFYGCTKAKNIYIAGKDVVITESAFEGSSTGTSAGTVKTYDTVKTIQTRAFYGCTGIATFTLYGATSATIATVAFYGCTGASNISVYAGFISIGESAFENSTTAATSADIYIGTSSSKTMATIGKYAFKGCTKVDYIDIYGNNTTICESAFENCSDGVTSGSIYVRNSVKTIETKAFYSCEGFTTIVVYGATDATIGTYAFYGAANVNYLCVYSGVVSVGESAFENSATTGSAAEFYIGSSSSSTLETIGKNAFKGCTMAKFITVRATTIGESAFEGCSTATSGGSITVSSKMSSIETRAFYGCTGITTITIEGATDSEIKTLAFYGCSTVSTLTIYNSVKTIGVSAFEACSTTGSAATFNIGATASAAQSSTLATISNKAFYGCTKAKNIYIAGNNVSIGESAFEGFVADCCKC